jgi:hypothetical protein
MPLLARMGDPVSDTMHHWNSSRPLFRQDERVHRKLGLQDEIEAVVGPIVRRFVRKVCHRALTIDQIGN